MDPAIQAAIDAAVAAGVQQANAQVLQLQNDLATLQAAQAQAAGGGGGAPAGAFSLLPAANGQVIDYSTREGQRIGSDARKPFPTAFSLSADHLYQFTSLVHDSGDIYGYNRMGGILVVPNAVGETVNISVGYSMRSVAEVRAHAMTYVFTQTREAQDSQNLYGNLIGSLTQEAQAKILQFMEEYTIADPNNPMAKVKVGALLLRIIVRESHIDTAFTSRQVRLQLSSLDILMNSPKCNSNIDYFNRQVNGYLAQLNARDERTLDLMTNIIKGYKSCGDKRFVEYVNRLEERIDDGEDIDAATVMARALTKYKVYVQRGEWQAPTAEDEKIIALETTLEAMRAETTKVQPKGDGGNKPRRARRKQEAWQRIEPKRGEPLTKQHNGKEFKWCSKHQWCMHSDAECRNINANSQVEARQQATPVTTHQGETPSLDLMQQLSAMVEDNSDHP